MSRPEYIRLTDAAQEYGVRRSKLWRLVREGKLTPYEDPTDGRVTLLKRSELDTLMRIRPKKLKGA